MNTSYAKLVTDAREAARDILRARKVSDLLGFIRTINNKIKSIDADRETIIKNHEELVKNLKKNIAKHQHTIRTAEITENPELENIRKSNTTLIESIEKDIVMFTEKLTLTLSSFDKSAEIVKKQHTEKIEEYNEKIAKWESGESLVSFDDLKYLAEDLIAKRVQNDFISGKYDSEVTETTN